MMLSHLLRDLGGGTSKRLTARAVAVSCAMKSVCRQLPRYEYTQDVDSGERPVDRSDESGPKDGTRSESQT
jgi:hypothetical protein